MSATTPDAVAGSPLGRLWRYNTRHRPRIIRALVYTCLNKLFDVAPELLIGIAVDVVVSGEGSLVAHWFGIEGRGAQLVFLASVNFAIWLLESFTEWLAALEWRNLAQTVEHEMRMDAYGRVQDLELAFFEDRSTGGLMAVLNDDVNQLERFLDVGAGEITRTFMNVILVGIVFAAISWQLFILAFLPVPVIIWGSLLYQRRFQPRYARVREEVGILSGMLANNLGGIATIKAFTAEPREVSRIDGASRAYMAANRDAIRISSAFVPLIRVAILIGFTCTLLIGGWYALDGALRVGLYSVLVFMTQRLLWPLTRLGEVLDLYQRAMASTRRILNLIDTQPTILPGARTLADGGTAATVEFENVHFAYSDGNPVLDGVNITVPAGETHAIVGLTGSGKSTMVKLLMRFYEPTSGVVRVDGIDVGELSFTSLRGAMGLVSQDTFLFDGTIAENIAYGRPDALLEDITRAAHLAEANEFIDRLPGGYQTIVGERGQKLSGGQRQRLAIARAILRDPRILILDEATSSVDNETEAAIQRSMQVVSRDRTTLVIAHRLSTVRTADRIHVLEHGRIAESGTHDELLRNGGLYSALWRVQTGEVIAEHLGDGA